MDHFNGDRKFNPAATRFNFRLSIEKDSRLVHMGTRGPVAGAGGTTADGMLWVNV